ncbi:substrate-binding periplasmic protein [Dongshaea marina]|uniref:substrate-binding periplasmic protein n=1 Tax=Dongshaea marina TaxID=2047966 RepID=UPI000D3E6A2E|nr:transporter substrate-binding domain-containing protein [Dongshaea marina]
MSWRGVLLLVVLMTFSFELWTQEAKPGETKTQEPIGVEVLADANYPPYSYVDSDGEPAGLYYEILSRIFNRMKNFQVSIRPIHWKRGLEKLRTGDGFALYPPYYLPRERPYMWPYSYPILDEKVIVVCHQDSKTENERIQWPDDYIGLRFGLNAGFRLGGKRFWALVNGGQIEVMVAKGNRHNILKLLRNRIDCYINDQVAIYYSLGKLIREEEVTQEQSKTIIQEVTVSRENGYLGYASNNEKFPFRDDFTKKFNVELAKMRHSGELESLVRRFIEGD